MLLGSDLRGAGGTERRERERSRDLCSLLGPKLIVDSFYGSSTKVFSQCICVYVSPTVVHWIDSSLLSRTATATAQGLAIHLYSSPPPPPPPPPERGEPEGTPSPSRLNSHRPKKQGVQNLLPSLPS